jgi:uncharacterized membrane protein
LALSERPDCINGQKLLSLKVRVGFTEEKHVTLESSKNIGGVGAILLFVGVLPWIAPYGWIIALIGLIMALIGFKGLADYYNEAGVFNNALYALILAIVGFGIFFAILITSAFGLLSALGLTLSNITEWSTAFSQADLQAYSSVVWGFVGQIILGAVVLWVCLIVAAILLRKSLGVASMKTGVGMFGTTGLLMLIGAVIPLLGLLLIWIGLLLLAVAFFSIRPQQAQASMPAQPPTQV